MSYVIIYFYIITKLNKMMENISTLNVTGKISEKSIMKNSDRTMTKLEKTVENPVMNDLIAEGGENFFNYLEWHGLTNEDNMLVLSSRHHYYYDPNELQAVTTLINVKKLNLIKHLDTFLHSIEHVLSPESNFIGCFSDWKTQKGTGLTSRMYKGFINFIDSKIDVDYDKKDVSKLLESHGFRVMDMTEINGLTYFRAQNLGMQAN
jgi:hypothetical protein